MASNPQASQSKNERNTKQPGGARGAANFPIVLIATLFLGGYWGLYYAQRDSVYPHCGPRGKKAVVATEPVMGVGPKFDEPSGNDPDCESEEQIPDTPPERPQFLLMSRAMAEAVNELGITPEPNVTPLPAFSAPALDGTTFRSTALQGKPVFINIWATWCAECEKEIPVIEGVWKKYKDKGIVVLGVNWKENEEKVAAYTKKHGMTFPIILDKDGAIMKKLHRTGTEGVPETYLVDTASRRVGWLIGPGQWNTASGDTLLTLLSEGKGFQSGVSYQASTISASQMQEILKRDPPGGIIIDLRSPEEYKAGHISKWAFSAPPGEFMKNMTSVPFDVPLVLVDGDGEMASKIAQALAGIGFSEVGALEGGMQAWKGRLTKEVAEPKGGNG